MALCEHAPHNTYFSVQAPGTKIFRIATLCGCHFQVKVVCDACADMIQEWIDKKEELGCRSCGRPFTADEIWKIIGDA